MKPWWQSRTFWSIATGAVALAPVVVNDLTPILTTHQAFVLLTIAAAAAHCAAAFARAAGLDAAAAVLRAP